MRPESMFLILRITVELASEGRCRGSANNDNRRKVWVSSVLTQRIWGAVRSELHLL